MNVNKILVNNNDSNYTHSIFDISEYSGQQYSTLSDALNAIPQAKQKGGMTIRYVQTNDNKYVQCRCMAQNFTTDITQWQCVENELIPGSHNLVENGVVATEVGKHYNYSVAGDSHIKICDLSLKSGSKLLIVINGTSAATRLIIRANSNQGTILQDNCVIGRKYEITLHEDITSLWLWTNGSYDLNFDLYFGIAMVLKNIEDGASLSESGLYRAKVETQGDEIKEIIQSVNIKQGDVFYIIADGTINGRLIIRANKYNGSEGTVTLADNVISGKCYKVIASENLNSIGIWTNSSVECSVYIYTNALKEIVNLNTDLKEEVDDIYSDIHSIVVAKSGSGNTKITDIELSANSHVYIKISGTSTVSELSIWGNSVNDNLLINNVVPNRVYDVLLSNRTTSLWLKAPDHEYDLNFEISTGVRREVAINSDLISISRSGIFASTYVNEDTTTVEKEVFQNINVKAGETIYLSCIGTINGRLIVKSNNKSELQTVYLADNVVPNILYKYTAPVDLLDVSIWCNNSADISLYLYTKASESIFEYIDNICLNMHDTHFILSSNIFDGEYISGKGIKNDGTMYSDSNYGVTKNYIPIDAGCNIVATSNNGTRYMRFIAAYDKSFKILADKGLSSGTYSYWTVPDGVYYIKITVILTAMSANDFAIYRSKGLALKTPDQYNIVRTDNRNLLRLKHEPLSLMPSYMTELLSYRPLGSLSRGYICMITDDGAVGLASYTIPLAVRENIPMTFAVMKESAVFADETMTTTVLDAVNNHNCDLAQHGGTLWDLMSEIDLNNYFNDQKAFFDNLGVELKGAVIPQHRTNSLVKAIAGARFGVVRSGYYGLGVDNNANYSITNYYDYYTSGSRSNIFGLSSYECAHTSISYNHFAADYAKSNNKILIVYFHENDISTEEKSVIEDLITYAKSIGLEFIKLGDIPTLETWSGN